MIIQMKIYGIYDTKKKEECLRVGEMEEIAKFLDLTAKEIGRALRNNNLIREKYKMCYLFNEEG